MSTGYYKVGIGQRLFLGFNAACDIVSLLNLLSRCTVGKQTFALVLTSGGAVGLWLILANILNLIGQTMPGGLAVFGIIAGLGYILLVFGFLIGEQRHPLFYIGSLVAVLGYSIWAIWLGRLFLMGGLGM